jgi:hypothetical protein
MIEIQALHKLPTFYPSQWEGRTPEGDVIHIRYRHGDLMVWIEDQTGQQRTVYTEDTGERDGFDMETETMKSRLASVCRFLDGGEDNRGLTEPDPSMSNE